MLCVVGRLSERKIDFDVRTMSGMYKAPLASLSKMISVVLLFFGVVSGQNKVWTSMDSARDIELLQEDTDLTPGSVDMKIRFKGAFKESTITGYSVWETRDAGGGALQRSGTTPLMTMEKQMMEFPVASGRNADLMDLRLFVPPASPFNMDLFRIARSGDIWGGGYAENEDLTVTIQGPGSILFIYMDIDDGDGLDVNGVTYDGYAPPPPVSIRPGIHVLRWHTDGITNQAHGGFILNWIPENIYDVAIIKEGFIGPFISVVARSVEQGRVEEMPLSDSPLLTGPNRNTLDRYLTTPGPTTTTTTSTTRSVITGGLGPPFGGQGLARAIKFIDTRLDRFVMSGFLQVFGSYTVQTFHAFLVVIDRLTGVETLVYDIGTILAPRYNQGQRELSLIIVPPELQGPIIDNLAHLYVKVHEQDITGKWNENPVHFAFVDVFSEAPVTATFHHDIDPRSTFIEGNITWVPPYFGGGLTGFRVYWDSDVAGSRNQLTKTPENVAGFYDLDIVCPPSAKNRDYNLPWGEVPCPNGSPFAPKCLGKSCNDIIVFQQGHEFFVTRAWHEAGGLYNNDEVAEIWFPYNGTIEPVMMDVKRGDSLVALWLPDVPNLADRGLGIPMRVDPPTGEHRYVRWRSDLSGTGAGWTLKYVPDLEPIRILNGAKMPLAATGFSVHSVYSIPPSTGLGTDSTQSLFTRIEDYIVMTAECESLTMRCPLPPRWRHHNYTTNSDMPLTAIGSCRQQSSTKGESWFFFERLSCASYREFLDDDVHLVDAVELNVIQSDVDKLLAEWRALDPLAQFFWESDLRLAPIRLPPRMVCKCRTATRQFVGLGTNVAITTPAPIQEATEVGNLGQSGVGAQLQIFTDRTFTVLLGAGKYLPTTEKRFFVQAKTEFQGDHISISTCIATENADVLEGEKVGYSMSPLDDYCAIPEFDIREHVLQDESISNVQRISLRRFKFQGSSQVVLRCFIDLCPQQPCGSCPQRRGLGLWRTLMQRKSPDPALMVKGGFGQNSVDELLNPGLRRRLQEGFAHTTNAVMVYFPPGTSSGPEDELVIDFNGAGNVIVQTPVPTFEVTQTVPPVSYPATASPWDHSSLTFGGNNGGNSNAAPATQAPASGGLTFGGNPTNPYQTMPPATAYPGANYPMGSSPSFPTTQPSTYYNPATQFPGSYPAAATTASPYNFGPNGEVLSAPDANGGWITARPGMPSSGNQPTNRYGVNPDASQGASSAPTSSIEFGTDPPPPTTTTEAPPPPVFGGRAGIRSITDYERISGNVPTSTLPPNGVWQPSTIHGTAVGSSNSEEAPYSTDKPLPSEFSYAPIIIEATMNFRSLSPAWFLNNKEYVEDSLRTTFALSPYEDARITRIRAVVYRSRELFMGNQDQVGPAAAARKLASAFKDVPARKAQGLDGFGSFGTEIEFILGLRDPNRLPMTEGNVKRMETGDYAMSQAFVLSLNQHLVSQGESPTNLQSQDISVANVVVNTPSTTSAPGSAIASGSSVTAAPQDDSVRTTAAPGAMVKTIVNDDDDSDLPKFLPFVLIAVGVFFIAILLMPRKSPTRISPEDHHHGAWVGGNSPKNLHKSMSMSNLERRGRGSGYQRGFARSASMRSKGSRKSGKKPGRSQSMRSQRSRSRVISDSDSDALSDSSSDTSSGSSSS